MMNEHPEFVAWLKSAPEAEDSDVDAQALAFVAWQERARRALAAPAVANAAPVDCVERVARAICSACEENPDHQGDAQGNAFRWQDYRVAARVAIAAQAPQAALTDEQIYDCMNLHFSYGPVYGEEAAQHFALSREIIDFARAIEAAAAPNAGLVVDLKKIAHLIGSIFFAGGFVAETASERDLEALLIKTGYRYRSWEEIEIAGVKVMS